MVFPPIWGKKWGRSEHAHASYPGLSLRPPGLGGPCLNRQITKIYTDKN